MRHWASLLAAALLSVCSLPVIAQGCDVAHYRWPATFYWRCYPESYGSTATPQEIVDSGRSYMRHLRQDPETVHALAALSSSYQKRIRRGVFKSVKDLIEAIQNYIKTNNQNPKPFEWTKRVDEILEKVNHCKASTVTAH